MGLLRAQTKGFTLLLDPAKKTIYLLRASIYFYLYNYFTWSPWKRSNRALPHAPHRSHVMFHTPPLNVLVFCWLLHLYLPFDGHLRPWKNKILFVLSLMPSSQTMIKRPPTRSTAGPHPPRYPPPSRTLSFGWLLLKNKKWRRPKVSAQSINIFFNGLPFCTQCISPCAIYSESRVPPAAHSMKVTRLMWGRVFDRDERSQRQRRTSAGLEKNCFKIHR